MALGAWPLRAVMALCRPPGPPPPPAHGPGHSFSPPPGHLSWPPAPHSPGLLGHGLRRDRSTHRLTSQACPHRDMLRAGAAPGLPWGPPTAAGPGDLPASPAPWQSLHVESRTDLGKKFHSLHQVHH